MEEIHKKKGSECTEQCSYSSKNFQKDYYDLFFLPATVESKLVNEILKQEEVVGGQMSGAVKILERSDKPLSTLMLKKFPIVIGCPLGDQFTFCEGDAIKCTPKGVVYTATCVECEENLRKFENDVLEFRPLTREEFTYVGETSRTFKTRVKEHKDSLRNLD